MWLQTLLAVLCLLVLQQRCKAFAPSSHVSSAATHHRTSLASSSTAAAESASAQISSEAVNEVVDDWINRFTAATAKVKAKRKGNVGDSDEISEMVDDLFISHETPFWRDMVACSWNIVTMEGKASISQLMTSPSMPADFMLEAAASPLPPKYAVDTITATAPAATAVARAQGTSNAKNGLAIASIDVWCDLTTSVGTGKAFVRLEKPLTGNANNDGWKAQRLLTVLMDLNDHPFRVRDHRIRGAIHGPMPDRVYWPDRRRNGKVSAKSSATSTSASDGVAVQNDLKNNDGLDHFVVVIGGGQGGLGLGARLELLGVDYAVLEAADKPGAAWRRRYPSLHLHDPVWYNHMPYMPFPPSWPIFCPRDKIADWMEQYAKTMDINVRTNTKVVSATQVPGTDDGTNGAAGDDAAPVWEIAIETRPVDEDNRPLPGSVRSTLRARHVVFATGNSSHPRTPSFPGADTFRGTMLHSSKYVGGKRFKGKRVVVVGANNSALDICQDVWEQGAESVTMIQRSPSLIVSTDAVLKHGLGPLYNEHPPLDHEDADLVATTVPFKQLLTRWTAVTNQMRELDKELHDGLIAAGYRLDFGPDGTGLFAKSATEGGGFYINMGAAELVTDGEIQIVHGTVHSIGEEEVVVAVDSADAVGEEDGGTSDSNSSSSGSNSSSNSEREHETKSIPADVIVFATGYDTLDQWVAEICGNDVAKSVGRTWGLGWGRRPHKDPGPWQGELRNMWKPTNVDGLWFQGGNLAQSRHYSRFLALQLAARYFGIDTPVTGIPDATEPDGP